MQILLARNMLMKFIGNVANREDGHLFNSQALSLALMGIMTAYCVGVTIFYFEYRGPDYCDLLFLTQCDNEESVLDHFGRNPEIVYHKGDVMPQLGWKLPTREISNKVLVYTNRSALRFYVYIGEGGNVEYVFTSNS